MISDTSEFLTIDSACMRLANNTETDAVLLNPCQFTRVMRFPSQ
jgi:hypothetical protein